MVANDPIGALAHLQLGRAYVQSGDSIRARDAYKELLTVCGTLRTGIFRC
jgi:eukaryotic-like serine/threonine-protein kinase